MSDQDNLAVVASVMENNGRYELVHRVYVVHDYGTYKCVQRGLLKGDKDFVFTAGDGWSSRFGAKIVKLPGEVIHFDWYDGWENGKNSRLTDWGWCYGMRRPSSKSDRENGQRFREVRHTSSNGDFIFQYR